MLCADGTIIHQDTIYMQVKPSELAAHYYYLSFTHKFSGCIITPLLVSPVLGLALNIQETDTNLLFVDVVCKKLPLLDKWLRMMMEILLNISPITQLSSEEHGLCTQYYHRNHKYQHQRSLGLHRGRARCVPKHADIILPTYPLH